MAILAYARVSTQDQDLSGQIEALTAAGATSLFKEKVSGARADRPQLAKLMSALKAGDQAGPAWPLDAGASGPDRAYRRRWRIIQVAWRSAMGHDVIARAAALDPAGGDCGV